MPCLLILLSILIPRIVMAVIFLATNWFSQAFQTILWPLLGFIFLPYTTLAYMGAMIFNGHQVTTGWLVLLIVAVVADLGGQGHSANRSRRRG